MKFTYAEIIELAALFACQLVQDNEDYLAFYPVAGGMFAVAESWADVHKSTVIVTDQAQVQN